MITADCVYSKRVNDLNWNEGIITSNQVLTFSFCQRFCVMLGKDFDAMIVKKEVAGFLHKLGVIHSLPSLLLEFCFVTLIYDGCEWFHGLQAVMALMIMMVMGEHQKTVLSTNCALNPMRTFGALLQYCPTAWILCQTRLVRNKQRQRRILPISETLMITMDMLHLHLFWTNVIVIPFLLCGKVEQSNMQPSMRPSMPLQSPSLSKETMEATQQQL
jgi:hypothetical protein